MALAVSQSLSAQGSASKMESLKAGDFMPHVASTW